MAAGLCAPSAAIALISAENRDLRRRDILSRQ